jgi:hypothetical protein
MVFLVPLLLRWRPFLVGSRYVWRGLFILDVVCSQRGRVVFRSAPFAVVAAMLRFVRTGSCT